MSLVLPAFADLTKATKDVLFGDQSGQGAFSTGGVQLKTHSMTAGACALAKRLPHAHAALAVLRAHSHTHPPHAHARTHARTHTTGGLVLNASTSLSPGRGAAVPSLSLTAAPRKSLLLMGIVDGTGSLTGWSGVC
jgi:hypothetical protein